MGGKSKQERKLSRDEKVAALIAKIQPADAVLQLPHYPTDSQKVWWNKYIGKPFRDALAKKGAKSDNARTWTHDKFIDEFCEERYPDLTGAEREQYHELIGEILYSYLANHTKDGTAGIKLKQRPPKTRRYGYDLWIRDEPEEFERMKMEFLKEKPDAAIVDIGSRRSLYSKLFARLPRHVQRDYRERASNELKASKELKLLFGNERDQFNENIPRRLKALVREAEICAKARICVQILAEDGNGNFTITSLASDSLKDFQKSQEFGRALHSMKQWVVKAVAKGKQVDGGAPPIAVYPDDSKDGFPCLPDFAGAKLAEAQKLMRLYITMVWMYMGGVGKVPWEEISNDIEQWIDPSRMPAGAVWKDPSSFSLAEVLVWLDFFIGCQDGTNPPEKTFQFCRVIAGPHPIVPGSSQETSRRIVRRADKDTWVLTFDETVTTCHRPGGMIYPDASKAYAVFLATGQCASGSSEVLAEGSSHPTTIIDGDTQATLSKYAEELPDDVRVLVMKLVDTLNRHQSHCPFSNGNGPWADKAARPALLPSSLPSDVVAALKSFIVDFWLPACYFHAPTEPGGPSTIAFFEAWQQKLLTAGILHHEASGTMLGGYFGVAWVIIALIKLVLNFSALRGDISDPVQLPAEYDVSRVPLAEWKRLLGWCRSWITKLESDIGVLSKNSKERQQSSSNQPPVAGGSEAALPPSASAPTQHSTTRRKSQKQKKAPARKSRATEDSEDDDYGDEDMSTSESEDESVVNYEGLDTQEESDTEPSDNEPGAPDFGPGPSTSGNAWGTNDDMRAPPRPPVPPPPALVPPSSSAQTPSVSHVFGPFRTLPAVKKRPLPKGSQAIVAGLTKCDKDIGDALRVWYELGAKSDELDIEEAEAAAATATSLPIEWQPLRHFVHTASLAWKRAATFAPTTLQAAYDFMMLLRESFPYVGAARRVCDLISIMNDDAQDLAYLRQLETRVNQGMAELRWIHKELESFENLSSQWAAKLANTWPPNDIPDDVAALQMLATPLLEWAEASEQLHAEVIGSRKTMSQGLGGPLDPVRASTRPCYRFGCPSSAGKLESLKECLKSSSTTDAPVLQEQTSSAPLESLRVASIPMSTTADDDMTVTGSKGPSVPAPPAQYVVGEQELTPTTPAVESELTTSTSTIPPTYTTTHPEDTEMPTADVPTPRTAPDNTTPRPSTHEVKKPATGTKRKRQSGPDPPAPPPPSTAGPSTRRNTRSVSATVKPQVQGKTRNATQQAAAINTGGGPGTQAKRRRASRT